MRPLPKSDFAKPTQQPHDFESAYYGWPICKRCHRSLEKIQATQQPCVSDEAIRAGQVFARSVRT